MGRVRSGTISGFLNVGGAGNGTLNITNNGRVLVGDDPNGDSTSSFTIGSSSVYRGNLVIQNGSTVNSLDASIGELSGSSGTVTVTDGSQWNNSSELYVGNLGTGTLNVTDGELSRIRLATSESIQPQRAP